MLKVSIYSSWGSFFNYVDQIFPIIDHLTPAMSIRALVDIGEAIPLLLCIRKNLYSIDISSVTYLPRLVNVFKERPLVVAKVGQSRHHISIMQ